MPSDEVCASGHDDDPRDIAFAIAQHRRRIVHQATGTLMQLHTVTAAEAFAMIVERSQDEERTVLQVAVDVLAARSARSHPSHQPAIDEDPTNN